MKFKKDDIVEVIKEDKWQGIDYPVGTQLRVREDQGRDSVVHIYDSMQKQGGVAKLWAWNLKLVKREEDENELKFKLGQTYICTKSSLTWFTEGKEYPVIVNDYGKLAIKDDDGTLWFDEELNDYFTYFKLKGKNELKFKIGDTVFGKDVITNNYYTGRIIEINHTPTDWASYCIDTVYGNKWLINDTVTKVEEEKPKIDLNNLTTAELREYVELLEDKEEVEFLLECFIEKVTK